MRPEQTVSSDFLPFSTLSRLSGERVREEIVQRFGISDFLTP